MALNNYTALQAAVADWLLRADLSTQIVDFITIAEAHLAREVRKKTIRAALSLTSAAVSLPAMAELRSLRLNTATPSNDLEITVGTPEIYAAARRQFVTAGRPRVATVVDGVLLLAPTPDQTYAAEITYYEKLVPLASSTTNSILTEAPDIYLYATLAASAPFLQHDERATLWMSLRDAGIASLNLAREREEYGSSALQPMMLPRVFG